MKNPLFLCVALPLAFLPAAQAAGTINISSVDTGNLDSKNYNLDTLGSLDWKLFTSTTTASNAKSGGSGLSDMSYSDPNMGAGFSSTSSGANPGYTWTGGSPTATGNNTDLEFAGTPFSMTTGEVFGISADATTSLRTLYLFVGVNRAGGTLSASLSDGSASAVTTLPYDVGSGGFGFKTYKIDFAADAVSGETLDVTWTKTDDNSHASSQLRFQGAALTVPEPSSALLLGLAGLLAFRRRR